MKSVIIIAIAFVLLIPLSVFADSHNIHPVFLESDLTTYSNGSQVVISGNIKNYDPSSLTAGAITYLVKSPDNNIVKIGMLSPNSDGSFQFTFTTGGNLWEFNGDYLVEARYGSDKSEIAINYVGESAIDLSDQCKKYGCTEEEGRTAAELLMKDLPVSIWTDKTDYTHNDTIVVKGQVRDVSVFPVTLTILSPLNSIVTVKILSVDSDGSFETTIDTDGAMWKYDGTYTIKASYGSDEKSNSAKIELTGGVAYSPTYSTPTVPEQNSKCGAGTELVNGRCVVLDYYPTSNPYTREQVESVTKNTLKQANDNLEAQKARMEGYAYLEGMTVKQYYQAYYGNLDKYYEVYGDNTNDYGIPMAEPTPEPETKVGIAGFVDITKDPQSYVNRYNSEPLYKKWFDDNYSQYDSIEQAVGLELTQKIPDWIKNVFLWYGQDQVSEEELLNAIKYLINEKILIVN